MFTLYRALRNDRLLAVLTLVLVVGATVPLFFSPFLPFIDLPDNVGAASLLWRTKFGKGVAHYHYHVNLEPIPYWTAYLIIAAVNQVAGTLIAAKAIVWLNVVLLPLGVMRLLIAVGRNPRLGLWAFAISWEHNLYWGWVTYLFGVALALFTLALLVEAQTWIDAVKVGGWTMVIALTHPLATAFVITAAGMVLIVSRPFFRRAMLTAIGLSGVLISGLPWLVDRLEPKLSNAESEGIKKAFSFDWHSPATKAASFWANTMENLPDTPKAYAPAFAFALMLVGPAAIAAVKGLPHLPRAGRAGPAIALAALLLYAALPMATLEPVHHWHTYPRFASLTLLLLLLLPRPDLRGARAWALAPGIIAALCMDWAFAKQLRTFAVNARPFVQIIDAVKPNRRVLTILNEERDPAARLNPYNQFHAYIAGAKRAYDPYMFHNENNPLVYRGHREIPVPNWRNPREFSLDKHGRRFDYVVVQGLGWDPFAKGIAAGKAEGVVANLLVEAGKWRLYEIVKLQGPPPPPDAGSDATSPAALGGGGDASGAADAGPRD